MERRKIRGLPSNDLNQPPITGARDLARLIWGLAAAALRHPFLFDAQAVFEDWARRTAKELETDDLVVNLVVKKLLLVGSPELSRHILAEPPSRARLSAGSLKRTGMAFLASHALTISDDQEWSRRRAFNESVLQPQRRHHLAPCFVRYTLAAFESPINSIRDLRAAMGRTMLGVVFGGEAPVTLVSDIETLFGLVQNPVKRLLVAPYAHWKRRRLYAALQESWRAQPVERPGLLGVANRSAAGLADTELLQQVPHWMFTFTGSATDLVMRTVTLITSYPAVHRQAMAELEAAGPLDAESFERADLFFLNACLLEASHWYPPVTRTFHRAIEGTSVGGVHIPAGMEIMHLFPLFSSGNREPRAVSRRFNPQRWMRGHPACTFDPFLGGARTCPGKNLILLICATAVASLLRQQVVIQAPGIGAGPLPANFPRRGVHVLHCS